MEPGSLLKTYTKNRSRSDEIAVESTAIGTLVCAIAEKGFEGSMTELLDSLNALADDKLKRSKSWPKTPRGLSGQLKRLARNPRKLGYVFEDDDDTAAGGRTGVFGSHGERSDRDNVRNTRTHGKCGL